jgi:protein O-mannosyl-transferase
LSKKNKINYILRKKHLSLRELSAQTGLTETEVAQILEKGNPERLPTAAPPLLQGGKGTLWVCSLLLLLAVASFYFPVLKNDFVNWDDKDNITENLQIRRIDGDSLRWMFMASHMGNWIPLTWLSFALNYRLGGLDPRMFHATNVLFHALNTLLVFLVCLRLMRHLPEKTGVAGASRAKAFGLPIAFLTALLFGLHPIHVESVAWATERKDVLYAFFYLGALWLYLGEPFSFGAKGSRYWACLGLYLLALMSKPMAITLPLVFLVLDGWPLGRWGLGIVQLLKEKAAFFALALGAAWVTVASHEKALFYVKSGAEFYWVMNAFRSLVFYPVKMAWPAGLTSDYPFPPKMNGFYLFEEFCAAVAVILLSSLLFRYRHKAPYLLAAWAYYVVTLLPVLGIVQTGSEAAADRFTYLASLGFFLPFSAGVAFLVSYRWPFYAVLLCLATVSLGWGTMGQIGIWRNSQTLWERVEQVYPEENPTAYCKLGAAYLKAGRYDDALVYYGRATVLPPPLAPSFNGLGAAFFYKDKVPEAVQDFEIALKLDPRYTAPRLNLWKVYENQGRHEEAAEQMWEALKIEPDSAVFHNNLGVSYGSLKRDAEAAKAFEKACQLDPDHSEYLVNLADLYRSKGQAEKALQWYRKGIDHQPREPVYYLKMAEIYLSQGLKAKALEKLQTAWNLNPTSPELIQQIGEDFGKAGQAGLAQECMAKARAMAAGNSGALTTE